MSYKHIPAIINADKLNTFSILLGCQQKTPMCKDNECDTSMNTRGRLTYMVHEKGKKTLQIKMPGVLSMVYAYFARVWWRLTWEQRADVLKFVKLFLPLFRTRCFDATVLRTCGSGTCNNPTHIYICDKSTFSSIPGPDGDILRARKGTFNLVASLFNMCVGLRVQQENAMHHTLLKGCTCMMAGKIITIKLLAVAEGAKVTMDEDEEEDSADSDTGLQPSVGGPPTPASATTPIGTLLPVPNI